MYRHVATRDSVKCKMVNVIWDLTAVSSSLAINRDNLTDNCLAKVPYIRNLTRYAFRPSFAGAHYTKLAVQFLNDRNIKSVAK